MKRLFDVDPLTGAVQHFEVDHANGGRVLIHHGSPDLQPHIDLNKELANHTDGKSELGWHAASIPVDVAYKWLIEHGVSVWEKEHWPQVKRLLNSNEYRHLRVKHFML